MKFASLVTRAFAFVATTVLASGLSATAGTIEIQLSGLNLNYTAATDDIVDAGGAAGGNHEPSESDRLNAAVFLLDGVAQQPPLMTTDQYGDFFESISTEIEDTSLLNPVEFGTTDDGGSTFGFEWFMVDGGVPEFFLDLEFDDLTYILTDTGFFLSGTVSQLAAQQLPYGLAFTTSQPITLAYQSTNFTKMVAVNGNGGIVTEISASGQLIISGTEIPEPAAGIMLAGMLGLAGYLRLRWS